MKKEIGKNVSSGAEKVERTAKKNELVSEASGATAKKQSAKKPANKATAKAKGKATSRGGSSS